MIHVLEVVVDCELDMQQPEMRVNEVLTANSTGSIDKNLMNPALQQNLVGEWQCIEKQVLRSAVASRNNTIISNMNLIPS